MWQTNTTANLEQQNAKSLREEEDKTCPKLNDGILEEVSTYKYLEVINNNGNLSDHITEIEKKVRGANAAILAESGNTEFIGIKVKAIWQMVDATIIPITTYSCEGWSINKEENEKLQSIFNEALKTSLYLPQGTPTTILLKRNRKFTNRIYHKKEANPTSKEDKWNEGKFLNKRRNQNHT